MKLPCVLCWALGGHPQLQPHRVGADGGPRAPSRPWLSSKQPWAGSVLEGAACPAVVWAAPAPREAVGRLSVSAVAGGAPVGLPGQTSPAMLPSPRQPCQLRGNPSPPVPGPGSLTLRRSCPLCPSAARHPRGPDSCWLRCCAQRGLPSPQCLCSRCDPAPGGPSPWMWGSSHLVLAVAAPSALCSLLPSSRSPAFLQTPGRRPQHQPPVLRLLKLGHQLGGKKKQFIRLNY